ncbi:uncharacterized protein LOC106441895 [Brassica napus]|uniref:uncharacterized protein LOC106441895 n=1 Tax=Brassica napus TaxID=3708 RepID=UPI000BBE4753|nr:uncharacterized protein LOC106441895 [Brassica napus]
MCLLFAVFVVCCVRRTCNNCICVFFWSANATGVFWDFDECGIPDELNAAGVLQRMRQSLLHKGHRGPVSIQIYGDLTGLDFQSSDIKLNHFHSGEKREKMTKILEDIVSWSGENPEPSVGLLALGDVGDAGDDIVEVVELLKSQKNYRFMVLTPPPLPPAPPTVVIIMAPLPRGGF